MPRNARSLHVQAHEARTDLSSPHLPLVNHYAADAKDFSHHLKQLDDDDFRYFTDLILDGEESFSCIPPSRGSSRQDAALSILYYHEEREGCIC